MTSHELAHKLLEMPDKPVFIEREEEHSAIARRERPETGAKSLKRRGGGKEAQILASGAKTPPRIFAGIGRDGKKQTAQLT